ncbi:MAG: hypothetical protein JW953_13385 [Anaerolineae bacterium]|nr:hypothetical protein [Anaerolineae bacterium]
MASPLYQTCDVGLFDNVLTAVKQWDNTALEGFERLAKAGVDDDTLAKFLIKYANDAPTSNKILKVVGESSVTWSKNSFEGLGRASDEFGVGVVETIAKDYADDAVEKTFDVFARSLVNWSDDAFKDLAEVVNRHGANSPVVQQIDNLKDIDGIDRMMGDLAQPNDNTLERGARFHLELANDLGADKIKQLEVPALAIDGRTVKGPDIILKSNRIVEAKYCDWSDIKPPYVQKSIIEGNRKQIITRNRQFPGIPITVVLYGSKSQHENLEFAQKILKDYENLREEGYKVSVRWFND